MSFASTTARFLAAHPKCAIRIYDEYGDEHPIIADCICKDDVRNYSCEVHER